MNNNLIPAATVLVLKDSDIGMEVLMVKRSKRPPFENLYVFPGGKIDEHDYSNNYETHCENLNDELASAKLGLESGGLGYWIACIRECFEETGCEVKKIHPIQSYFPAPGSSESYYHLYLGEINAFDGKKIKGLEKENEDILVKSFKVDEVIQMLKEKKIINGLTLVALQWFFLEHYKG